MKFAVVHTIDWRNLKFFKWQTGKINNSWILKDVGVGGLCRFIDLDFSTPDWRNLRFLQYQLMKCAVFRGRSTEFVIFSRPTDEIRFFPCLIDHIYDFSWDRLTNFIIFIRVMRNARIFEDVDLYGLCHLIDEISKFSLPNCRGLRVFHFRLTKLRVFHSQLTKFANFTRPIGAVLILPC